MRLYLSSYQLGRPAHLFAGLVTGERRGWLVQNALDGQDEHRRRDDAGLQRRALAALGLEAEVLDLRRHDPSTIDQAVGEPDFVWVRGGNVFTLRMAMARSGFDRWVVDALADDRFVYAGFSAGPCVLAPSLRGFEHCDPVEPCVAEYGEVRFDGLGVLDRPIVPHLDSPDHPETELLGEVARRFDAVGQPYFALRDGEALVFGEGVFGEGVPGDAEGRDPRGSRALRS
ncbi:Type 1 glutamine amidotransferase-like domain-containing protein [Aestuariimicrobium soli]|uniref:Type 1 glutamine amidotransferase-like domain-containing protein n=1 Tax=Aestuariimicrobium soli TaxID=2035834 RepID=UPI003EB78607